MEERNRRRSTSVRQLELIIQYMEGHRDLALGRVRSKEARALAGRLWEQLSDLQNAEGAYRTPKEWSKFWNDYKCRIQNKSIEIQRELRGTGGGPSHALQLTPLEDRVASIVGRDVGPLTGVRIDPVINTEEHNEEVEVHQENLIIVPPENSPIIDLSNIEILHGPGQQETYSEQPTTSTEPIEPIPRQENTLPQPSHRNRERRRIMRPHARASIVHQNTSNTQALNDARATIACIEEMRARTEESMAAANLRQAEAAVKLAEAMSNIAQALQSIAESMRARSQYQPNDN